jgi:hypothetical protein
MSEIHIGPHTRGEAPEPAHGEGAHTFDREINSKAIALWVLGLLVIALVVHLVAYYFVRGLDAMDARKDPGVTPIEKETKQPPPPAPRLQVSQNFDKLHKDDPDVPPGTRSDLEDMQALRAEEDLRLETPAWTDQAQGRLRVPIEVAMQVIASRGSQIVGGGTGAPVQMTGPQTPAPPAYPAPAGAQPAGTAPGQPPAAAAPQPPARQEQ